MAKIYVIFEFVNKKGKKRRVRFPMEKQSYEIYHSPSVPEEWTQRMMLEDYKEYCSQKRYEKKVCRFPVDEDGNDVDFADPDSTNFVDKIDEEEKEKILMEKILKQIPPRQREAFCKVHLEGMKSIDAAKSMKILKSSFATNLSIAEKIVEEIVGRKIF